MLGLCHLEAARSGNPAGCARHVMQAMASFERVAGEQ